jgi:hypothetical protein
MTKKESNQITLKVRRATKERWDKDHAEYCGQIGKVISLAEFLDLLQKPDKK